MSLLLLGALFLGGGSRLQAGPGPEPVVKADEKSAKAVTIHDQWSLPGILGGGVKTTDAYTEGNVFLVVPVISTVGRDGLLSGDVLFIEPYSSWGEQGEVAASLGLGWRHYFTTQSVSAVTRHDGHQAGLFEEGVYLGANFFVDMLDTQFDNQFWQLGVGAEIGTRYFEIRGNYYIPLSDKQLALERRSRQTFTSSSTSTSQQVTGGDPFAVGNSIQQDVTVSSFATTTTSTTTIEQLFRLYEEGMEGWDVQASVLVPGLDRWMDVFLIGGYYSFDNQPFGPQTGGTGNVEGWKAGLEVRPVPAVVLNATWYEDERYVGSDWLYGLRLEIPFEMGDLGDGKGFWDRVGDAFTPRRRHLAERLVEPVRRQNEVIKIGNDAEEKVEAETSVKRVTKVVSRGPQRIVLQEDVVFVNNGAAVSNGIAAGSVAGTGSAEQPVDTLQAGANLAVANSLATHRVWNVYTQGGVNYTTAAKVPAGGSVKFIGSGMPVAGVGGKSFGAGAPPTLASGYISAPDGGDYLGIFGYALHNGGVNWSNYQTAEVIGNSLPGSAIRLLNIASLTVKHNTMTYNPTVSAAIFVANQTTNIQATIEGNTIEGYRVDSAQLTGSGIYLLASQTGSLTATVADNTVTGFRNGILAQSQHAASVVHATIEGNMISGALRNGIYFNNTSGDIITSISDNIIHDSRTGIYLGDSLQAGRLNVTSLSGNEIRGSTYAGIHVYTDPSNGGGNITVDEFDRNLITGTPSKAHVLLEQNGSSILSVQGTQNNTATPSPNTHPTGVTLDVEGTPTLNFLLNGDVITLPVDLP